MRRPRQGWSLRTGAALQLSRPRLPKWSTLCDPVRGVRRSLRGDMEGDGGATDASGSLCPGGLLLCDGFESAVLDARWSPISLSDATIAPSGQRAARGTRSLHVQKPAIATAGMNHYDWIEAAHPTVSEFHMRGFFYVQAPLPLGFAILMR